VAERAGIIQADAQRRAFQALCQGRGWTAGYEYLEEGKSARTEDINKRPMFKQMMADALARKFDVVVVHKLDRFSRNLRITLEYFDKLMKAGVAFVSISEQMDFTTPSGKVHLALLGAFAQYYSDNLSQETKKGWTERKAQGYYCGLLPFGAMLPSESKGESTDNNEQHKQKRIVPIPDPGNYPGLVMAFELAAQGKSDRDIALALNSGSYRTTGNRGHNLFSKDTVRGMLANRFYQGYLPDGNGGWIRAKHEAFIDEDLWNQAQDARRRNTRSTHTSCRGKAKPSSLSGIVYCWHCKGRMHIGFSSSGKTRLACSNRRKGLNCSQPSVSLSLYEEQIIGYLKAFHIPEDYRHEILELHRKLESVYVDVEVERAKLEARLQRITDLYEMGDLGKGDYIQRREAVKIQLMRLMPTQGQSEDLDRLAWFLGNVAKVWEEANQEKKNELARCIFDEIWIKDKQVIAVKPRPDFEPFFRLNYEDFVTRNNEGATPMGLGVPCNISQTSSFQSMHQHI